LLHEDVVELDLILLFAKELLDVELAFALATFKLLLLED